MYQVKALAEGDGFTEKKNEPASIDELLALSMTFGIPELKPELKATVQADLQTAGTTSRSRSMSACFRTSSCSRAGSTTSSRKA